MNKEKSSLTLVDVVTKLEGQRRPKGFTTHNNWDEGSESLIGTREGVIIYPELVQKIYKKVPKKGLKRKKIKEKVKEKEEKIKTQQDIKKLRRKNRPLL